MNSIPFNQPFLCGAEYRYMRAAMETRHLSGDGEYTRRCSAQLEQLLGVPRCLLTTSCTHALEMTALLLDLQPGDEVILPSFTFVSTANAYCLRGVVPRFLDIRPDTLNLDETLLASAISPRTRAIVVVHYAGVGCEMDVICRLAAAHQIPVIEDNAHGLFGRYQGRALGTFGELATLSFHETKNVTCGEGGALLINAPRFVERAEIIREKGTDRSRFFRGQVDKYTWTDLGSSYLPSDLLAAFLLGQIENAEQIQASRKLTWHHYAAGLAAWAATRNVRLPVVPETCEQAYHMFYLLFPTERERDGFIAHLRGQGILSVFHYLPLHLSPVGRRLGGREGQCPVTEDVSRRLVRLPFFAGLGEADQDRVIRAALDFVPPARESGGK